MPTPADADAGRDRRCVGEVSVPRPSLTARLGSVGDLPTVSDSDAPLAAGRGGIVCGRGGGQEQKRKRADDVSQVNGAATGVGVRERLRVAGCHSQHDDTAGVRRVHGGSRDEDLGKFSQWGVRLYLTLVV